MMTSENIDRMVNNQENRRRNVRFQEIADFSDTALIYEPAGDVYHECGDLDKTTRFQNSQRRDKYDGILQCGFSSGADIYVTEAYTRDGHVRMGTCVLLQDPDTWGTADMSPRRFVITAAHCLASLHNGKVEKYAKIRLRIPRRPWQGFDPKQPFGHGRFRKINYLWEDHWISHDDIYIHDRYDGNWSNGFDVALIALPSDDTGRLSTRPDSVAFNLCEYNSFPNSIRVCGFPIFTRYDKSHVPYWSGRQESQTNDWRLDFQNNGQLVNYPLSTTGGISGGPIIVDDKIIGIHNAADPTKKDYGIGRLFTVDLKKWIRKTFNLKTEVKAVPQATNLSYIDQKWACKYVDVKKEKEELEEENEKLEKQIKKMKEESNKKQAQIKEHEEAIAELKRKNSELKRKKKDTDDGWEELMRDFVKINEERDEVERKQADILQEWNNFMKDYIQMESDKSELQRERVELQTGFDQFQEIAQDFMEIAEERDLRLKKLLTNLNTAYQDQPERLYGIFKHYAIDGSLDKAMVATVKEDMEATKQDYMHELTTLFRIHDSGKEVDVALLCDEQILKGRPLHEYYEEVCDKYKIASWERTLKRKHKRYHSAATPDFLNANGAQLRRCRANTADSRRRKSNRLKAEGTHLRQKSMSLKRKSQALCAKVNDKLRQHEQMSSRERDNDHEEIHVKTNHQQKANCIDDSEDVIDDHRGTPRQDNVIAVNTEQQHYGGGSLALSFSQFDPDALLIDDGMEAWCHSILGDHSIYGNKQKKEREPWVNKNHLKDVKKTKKNLEPLWSRDYIVPSFTSSGPIKEIDIWEVSEPKQPANFFEMRPPTTKVVPNLRKCEDNSGAREFQFFEFSGVKYTQERYQGFKMTLTE